MFNIIKKIRNNDESRLFDNLKAEVQEIPQKWIAVNEFRLHGMNRKCVTVGRPIGLLLTRKGIDATVTLTHTKTRDIGALLRQADVVVAAAGVGGMVTADMVKPGAIVLDVGVSREVREGRSVVVGDVDESVWEIAAAVSPNPGGVGPMTRALLLRNVVDMAQAKVA